MCVCGGGGINVHLIFEWRGGRRVDIKWVIFVFQFICYFLKYNCMNAKFLYQVKSSGFFINDDMVKNIATDSDGKLYRDCHSIRSKLNSTSGI